MKGFEIDENPYLLSDEDWKCIRDTISIPDVTGELKKEYERYNSEFTFTQIADDSSARQIIRYAELFLAEFAVFLSRAMNFQRANGYWSSFIKNRAETSLKNAEKAIPRYCEALNYFKDKDNFRRIDESYKTIAKCLDKIKHLENEIEEANAIVQVLWNNSSRCRHDYKQLACDMHDWLQDYHPEVLDEAQTETQTEKTVQGGSQMQTEVPQVMQTEVQELETPKAKALLKRACEVGLCSYSNGVWKWEKTKSLLAYFAACMSDALEIGKGCYIGTDGESHTKINWKPFEMLFRVTSLALAQNDYRKIGNLPIGHKVVDSLF